MSNCPGCGATIGIDGDRRISEILVCPECSSELELVAVSPPALALAPEVEEDWGE
ncbi:MULTISPECIES: lysine biosynthesis protein LysW [unclassified Micromonospora]|uniref:lysine biosynthesis protein LysW n=1 Tax=unclassified Micromonospora TaxID=2617518 RepID=UPI001C224733|nr:MULTISPECIES: lysine biosynthesis protein LysW [unclassified Micromonospora]MBU8858611.1 lysine biosynthesis protein LysW [Micromonospora sp. WMMB482]MDM4784255.1 lysine biosynthesis protein LysW [Micromonospora sp. b486]